MAGKSRISPDLLALSSNGDSSSDDDVFLNSRLDVMAGNYDQFNQKQIAQNPNLYLQSILGYKMDKQSPSPVFSPSPRREQNAVIFSIIFCGKNFGEVGLFEPDISILNWPGFKSYLFSSLNLELSDSFLICYCDEEGDKIPIETEEEYQEALKIAKQKASEEDKFYIYITRLGGGGFPSSLRSLVSSSLRRVNSVGSSKCSSANQTIKKDVTTSTSFQNLGKEANSDSFDFCGENKAITYFIPFETQVSFSEEQDMADRLILQECALPHSAVVKFEPTSETTGTMQKCYLPPGSVVKIGDSSETAPLWFADYMKQFKEDLCQDVYSKIEEMFEFSVGHLRTTEVEKSVKSLLTVYSSELQNKVLCCCKTSSGECSKEDTCEKRSHHNVEKSSEIDQRYEAASYAEEERNLDDMHSKIDPPGMQDQDYFLQKLLKREQEILDFLDSTNEKIKQKIEINNDFNNSWRNCNGNDLGIEERERVLNRIEDFRQRQSRTADEIGRLHAAVTQKEDGCDIFKSSFLFPYNAKFIEDKTYKDGDTAEVGQMVTKTWVVQNIGTLPWDEKTFLRCINKEPIRPNSLVQCPPLSPGKIGTVSVSFMAPQFNGDYHIQWRFQQDNTLFGDHLWCYLKVVNSRHNVDERIERIIKDSVSPCPSNTFVISNDQQPELLLTTADPESRLVDTAAANFNENIRLYSDMNELFVSSMETDQLLNFLLYVLNVTNKDLPTMRDSEPYKILRDLVVDGNQPKHFQRLVKYLDLEVRSNRAEIRHTLNNTVRGFCDLVFSKKTEENLVEENVNLNYVCSKDDAQIEKVETGEGRNLDSSSLVEIACLCDASCHKFIQELKIKFAEEATRCTVCRRNNSSGLCLHSKSERNKENWDVGDKEECDDEYDEECENECADEEGECEGEYREEAEEYEHEKNSAEKENKFERKQDSTCVSEAYSELFNNVNISGECPILKRKFISKPFEIPHLAYSSKIYKEENIEVCTPKSMDVEAEVDHPQECEGEDYLTHKCEREEVQTQGCEGRNEVQYFKEEEKENQGQESDEEEDQEQVWGEGQAQYSEEEEQAQYCEGEEYQVQECEEDLVQDCEEVSQTQDSEGGECRGNNCERGQVQYGEEGWVQESEEEEDQVLEGEECKIEHQTLYKDGGVDQPQNVEEKVYQPQNGEEESDFEKISVEEDFVPEKVECREEVSQVCSEDSDESDDSDCSDYSPTDSEYSESEEESEIEDESGNRSLDYFPGITSAGIPLALVGEKVGNRELMREDFEAAAVINETKVKKDITSLHENFNQNVEVNLDFEVISQRPIQASSHVTTAMSSATADPLTFQEKHFNVSSRPPPNQIKVPDSDEESFDGLVFVRHSDIPSSAPATEPCSPSTEGVQLFRDDPLHESDLSQSCSSFSEFEADEDGEPVDGSISEGVPVAGGNTVEDSSLPQSQESTSNDECSESSVSSVMVDGAASIYFESNLPEAIEQYFDTTMEDTREDSNFLKSPDAHPDSGTSTSPTLNAIPSSSESGEPAEVALLTESAVQEESASEFEFLTEREKQ